MTTVQLSTVKPDYETIFQQLQAELTTREVWKDGLLQSSTGNTLTSHIAAIGAFSQYAIASALEEATLEAAKNDSSVYAWAIGQGIRIARKSSSQCSVELKITPTFTNPIAIPAYTQFVGQGGILLYNRTSFLIPANTSTFVTDLYQGEVVTQTVSGTGEDFQTFISTEQSFVVSDNDVVVRKNNTIVDLVTNKLWERKGLIKEAVWDRTLKTGQLFLMFGNELYGSKPTVNDVITIQYVATKGLLGNDTSATGKKLTTDLNPAITGVITSGLSGGGDETNAYTLKKTAPILWGAFESAVTGSQYRALPVGQYPGVIDIKTFAQRELSTTDLRYMNLVKIVLLTSSPWSQSQYDAFEKWYTARSIYSTRFYFEPPIQTLLDIRAEISCDDSADLISVKTKVSLALANLLRPRFKILGTNFYKSDIIDTIYAADSSIRYIRLFTPENDIFAGVSPPSVLTSTYIPTGGLVSGTYEYGISVTNATGETQIKPISVTIPSSGSIKLDWEPVYNGLTYRIYGRSNSAFELITILPLSVSTFTDNGTLIPNPAFTYTSVDTSGTHYTSLGNLDLTMLYTSRNL